MSEHDDCGAPLTIGQAAAHLGISVEALRYYERLGLVTPERTSSGHRLFTQRNLNALHVVCTMRQVDFSMAEISALIAQKTADPPEVLVPRVRTLLVQHRASLAAKRASLDAADALLERWLSDLDSTGW